MVAPPVSRKRWFHWTLLIGGIASFVFGVIGLCSYFRTPDAISENDVECADISIVPAMTPLDYTSTTRNGTLKRNETATPKISIMSREVGGKVTFSCAQGFMVEGVSEAVCQSNGKWSTAIPLCKDVECADISMVPTMAPLDYTSVTRNGTVKRNETAPPKISIMSREVGGKVTFSCAQGYMVEGVSEAVCQSNGKWSAAIPLCKEVECPPSTSLQNGYVTGNAPYKAGDFAQIECRHGYMMEGFYHVPSTIIACQDNGKWSRTLNTTKCVKACTYPGTHMGVTISVVKYYYLVGETVEFGCKEGYNLQGSRMLHCLDTAKWSNSPPNCIWEESKGK